MMFEKIIYISIIFLFLAYYIYKYVKNSSKTALLNIAFQVVAITMLVLTYINGQNISRPMQITVFVCGYLMPVITFVTMKCNFNVWYEVKIVLANIFLLCGNTTSARQIYNKLVSCYPKYRVYNKLGEICLKQNELNSALDNFEQAVARKNNRYVVRCKIAYIQYELGKYDEAMTILRNILTVKPNYMPACNLFAYILAFNIGKYNEALKMYFDLLESDKNNAQICYNIGAIYVKEKQNKNAKKFLEMAIRNDKKLYNAYYLLGYIHLFNKEYDLAEQYLLNCTKYINTYTKSYYMLARLYILKNEKGKATNCLNLAIAKDENLREKMHKEVVFDSIKDFVNGVDKIEKIANAIERINDNKRIIDITMFEEFNVDNYIVFEDTDTTKQEVLATTIKSKKGKSKKPKK